ncbi:hypothetical protein [Catenulispora pinisilvae]|uniref:hypothetical protein n=1 Tax=Catenulispora pinisilvae TaxID=2705253 RepID=UPI001892585E|nr:hypothetical protein [Catenulispora pinisilvae]
MTTELLQPIADAIAHEIARLEAEHKPPLGVTITIDRQTGTVTACGEGLQKWGPQQSFSATLDQAGLRHEIRPQSARIIVYPSTT